MLPANWFTPWVPAAVYGELYLGLCQALALPWLKPWSLAPAAHLAAAIPATAAALAPDRPRFTGASIIPFERARLAARR